MRPNSTYFCLNYALQIKKPPDFQPTHPTNYMLGLKNIVHLVQIEVHTTTDPHNY